MKTHPREMKVRKARNEIVGALLKIRDKHDLTDIEYIGILAGDIEATLKYALRFERHGNYDKPSGVV